MTRVHIAGFYDHAGFCPDCDAPCCYHYRHVSQSGTATVPAVTATAWTRSGKPSVETVNRPVVSPAICDLEALPRSAS